MRPISCQDIVRNLSGIMRGELQNQQITSVVIDSRKVTPGALFVAMKGERIDSHQFIEQVYEKGAVCVFASESFVQEHPVAVPEGKLMFVVEDPVLSLGRLAAWYRSTLNIPVVAVTGSVGKTTAKDMIAAALSGHFKTFKTPGNLNNKFGVPLAILSIEVDHEAAVIEMGMNHFGEIRYLADIVRPTMGVITNIGVSHIEFLGSQRGILQAKTEMLEFMDEKNDMFLCGDDPLLAEFAESMTIPHHLYGFGENCDLRALNWKQEGEAVQVETGDHVMLQARTMGRHMVFSMMASYGIGLRLGMTREELQKGIGSFAPTARRMNIYSVKKNDGGMELLDDTYNASPASMKAAIDVLCSRSLPEGGRRVSVLGDMFEMGFYSEKAHIEVGEYVADHPVDVLITGGKDAMYIAKAASKRENLQIYSFSTTQELNAHIQELLQENDIVLLKASNGMAFDTITKNLKGEEE